MEMFQSPTLRVFSPSPEDGEGDASSKSAALPHCGTTQSGASRSVAPAILRRATRFLEARKRGSENWYLSMKIAEGSVRCVCSLQVGSGAVRCSRGSVRVSVGCRPVGRLMEVVYLKGESLGVALGLKGSELRRG